MNIPLYDNGYSPKPKEEVRIQEVELFVYPDRFRVFVHLVVTPFLERPNILLTARNSEGRVVSEPSIIETMHNDMEFTLHLRGVDDPEGEYSLTVDVYYETRNPPQDRRVETFVVPSADQAMRDN